MPTSLLPTFYDFGQMHIGQSSGAQFSVVGHPFTSGEVSIDGQDRASFFASKVGDQISRTFRPVTRGEKFARLKVLIESDGSLWIPILYFPLASWRWCVIP